MKQQFLRDIMTVTTAIILEGHWRASTAKESWGSDWEGFEVLGQSDWVAVGGYLRGILGLMGI